MRAESRYARTREQCCNRERERRAQGPLLPCRQGALEQKEKNKIDQCLETILPPSYPLFSVFILLIPFPEENGILVILAQCDFKGQ